LGGKRFKKTSGGKGRTGNRKAAGMGLKCPGPFVVGLLRGKNKAMLVKKKRKENLCSVVWGGRSERSFLFRGKQSIEKRRIKPKKKKNLPAST